MKSCVQARAEQDNINHPAYGTWTADFKLQQNESRAFLEKYLKKPRVPWRHKKKSQSKSESEREPAKEYRDTSARAHERERENRTRRAREGP